MILLLRHGETFWNRERRVQGHTESDLTPLGEQQAEAMAALAAALVRQDGAEGWRLVASPIGRAQRTAEVCCGEWEGQLWPDIAARQPADTDRSEWFFQAPGGETFEDVHARAAAWLADLPPEPARRIIAVSHGVWGRLLRGAYAGLDRSTTLKQDVPQDALYRLHDRHIDRLECQPVQQP